MKRRTKIVATLGPASSSIEVLTEMVSAGVDIIRLNFSHGSAEEHGENVKKIRQIATELNQEVGILADLQGPKIRIARFKEGKIELKAGDTFVLDAEFPSDAGDEKTVGIDYKALPDDVESGDTLLLDDGRLVLKVKSVKARKIHCEVITGGKLSNNKGINRKGGGLTARALTAKDEEDLKTAVGFHADYIAISFPRDENDILDARKLIDQAGGTAGIVAKIERAEAVTNIDEIIEASDGVMVARGDLAVEIGDDQVPAVQKMIIQRSRGLDKPVITATQMMESMIHSTVPTRAEVSDVANAVLDQTDAVMLSAETAVGDNPILVVETMARVCLSTEKNMPRNDILHRDLRHFCRVDETIAMAAAYVANHLDVSAIISLTESGATPLWISRIRTDIPIYGYSRHAVTRGKMTLYRGVYPINFDVTQTPRDEINAKSIALLQERGLVQENDLVIITKGDHMGIHGGTNALKIITVGQVI